MRGHIKQRSTVKGTWTLVIELDRDPTTNKRQQKWITVKGSRREAERRLSEILHQQDTGSFAVPTKTTVADYLIRWLADYARHNLTPRSFERYESVIRVHLIPDIGSIPLTQLKASSVQQHYTRMIDSGLAALTVRYHHVVLHKALQTAIKWGLVNRNAADGTDLPRARHGEMLVWDADEMATFLECARTTQYHALFYLALYTGARRSELLALRWQDIDFIYGQISVNRSLHHLKTREYIFTQPKSAKSRRTIALPPSAFMVLQDYRKGRELEAAMLNMSLTEDDLVFNVLGKPLRPNTVSRAWAILAKKAGVKVIRLHEARHTHASLMLRQGIHPKIVQERLGHSSISITLDTYSHVAPGLQEAAALKFDDAVKVEPERDSVLQVSNKD